MPLFSFEGKSPRVHPTAFVAPTAVIVGDVTIEERASVWYNAVLRGDFNPIVVRRGANVQDCAVVHVTPRGGTEIGAGATVTADSTWSVAITSTPILKTPRCSSTTAPPSTRSPCGLGRPRPHSLSVTSMATAGSTCSAEIQTRDRRYS